MQPGSVLDGRYRIEERLGHGGMGAVYRAYDLHLEKLVALKSLHQDFSTDERAAYLLKREVKNAQELRHPNICATFDFRQSSEAPFIVMEFVDGDTLKNFIFRQPDHRCDEATFHRIAGPILAAVGHAHECGVIHRDLKPQNVMLMHSGAVRVMDFGIAANLKETRSRTTAGFVAFSPPYASPEQILGGKPQVSMDIYALGCLFYEMLTAEPPFSRGDILYQQLHVQPAPLEHVTPALNDAVLACLQKDVARRCPDVPALQALLAVARTAKPGRQKIPAAPFPAPKELHQHSSAVASSSPRPGQALPVHEVAVSPAPSARAAASLHQNTIGQPARVAPVRTIEPRGRFPRTIAVLLTAAILAAVGYGITRLRPRDMHDVPLTPQHSAEEASWAITSTSKDLRTLQAFLQEFPQSTHTPDVRKRIAALESAEKERTRDQEVALWLSVNASNRAEDVQRYLDKYPSGRFSLEAAHRLAAMQKDNKRTTGTPLSSSKRPSSDSPGETPNFCLIKQEVHFADLSASLDAVARKALTHNAGCIKILLQQRPEASFLVKGYYFSNRELANETWQARADVAQKFLVQLGVPRRKLSIDGTAHNGCQQEGLSATNCSASQNPGIIINVKP